jgi:hypothetical protein
MIATTAAATNFPSMLVALVEELGWLFQWLPGHCCKKIFSAEKFL